MQKKHHAIQPETTHQLSGDDRMDEVLMLDDESDLAEVLKEYLESSSFRVTCVKNGVDGLKQIMARDFDIILCDMLMPNLPGDMFYTAVQRVKPDLCRRFIFMTGHKGDRKIDHFIREVQGVMLWKPFEPYQLLETIRCVLKKVSKY